MMEAHTGLILPMLALAAWTLVILITLILKRVKHAGDANIDPQQMRTPDMAYSVCTESINNMANNFKHLFEVPVLFYVVCLAATLAGAVGSLMAALAWAFVALRVAHSVVQCTSNVVMVRLGVFAVSVVVLIVMTGLLVVRLI